MKNDNSKVRGFGGEYAFLSNFYILDTPIEVSSSPGFRFYTSEAAYMAAKSSDIEYKKRIAQNSKNPGFCKRAGRAVKLIDSWESIKDGVMFECLLEKFKNNQELKEKLILTRGMHLEETNTWGDRYWGVCNGQGKNMLGLFLMNVRDSLCLEAGNQRTN